MTERTWDLIHNEGEAGYNPIRSRRESETWEAILADERTLLAKPIDTLTDDEAQDRLDLRLRQIETRDLSAAEQAEVDRLTARLGL